MSAEAMGKGLVEAKIENLKDAILVESGHLSPEHARAVVVADALVDKGATSLSMPRRLIAALGLDPVRRRRARTTAGTIEVQTYEAVRLTVQGRDWIGDVTELPDDCPVLVGQLPLEKFDFVIDTQGQRLIGNPAHGGEPMIDLYWRRAAGVQTCSTTGGLRQYRRTQVPELSHLTVGCAN
jgi:hypothetical protein